MGVMHVARVDIIQARFEPLRARSLQGVSGSPGLVQHLKVWMERAEVEWHIGAEIIYHPVTKLGHLLLGVVLSWDEERRHLKPNVGLVFEPTESVQHWVKVSIAELVIKVLRKPFQIHIERVYVSIEALSGLLPYVACGNSNRLNVLLAARLGRVDGVFKKNNRVVVGEGHRFAPVVKGCLGDVFRVGTG